jgi:hypothetical protein
VSVHKCEGCPIENVHVGEAVVDAEGVARVRGIVTPSTHIYGLLTLLAWSAPTAERLFVSAA